MVRTLGNTLAAAQNVNHRGSAYPSHPTHRHATERRKSVSGRAERQKHQMPFCRRLGKRNATAEPSVDHNSATAAGTEAPAGAGRGLEKLALSERSQAQKAMCCVTPLNGMCPEQVTPQRQRLLGDCQGQRRQGRGVTANRDRARFGVTDILEFSRAKGRTLLYMCKQPARSL